MRFDLWLLRHNYFRLMLKAGVHLLASPCLCLLNFDHLVCWAKNRRSVLNEVKPNVSCATYLQIFLPNDPIHVYHALVDVMTLVCWASLGFALTCQKHATAPEFQPPVCCLLPAIWQWFGSCLTPTRGCQAAMLPNGAGQESGSGQFSEQDQ